jgi:hypothetical protein
VAANERHGGIVGRIIVVVVVIIADDEKKNRVRCRDIMFLRDDGGEGRGERVGLFFCGCRAAPRAAGFPCFRLMLAVGADLAILNIAT